MGARGADQLASGACVFLVGMELVTRSFPPEEKDRACGPYAQQATWQRSFPQSTAHGVPPVQLGAAPAADRETVQESHGFLGALSSSEKPVVTSPNALAATVKSGRVRWPASSSRAAARFGLEKGGS